VLRGAEKLAADVADCEAIDVHGEFDERRDYSSDAAIEAQDNSRAALTLPVQTSSPPL
jgi:hypothetical protein